MTVSFDSSVLSSYYAAKYGGGTANPGAHPAPGKTPTAPWTPKTTAAAASSTAAKTPAAAAPSTDPAHAALQGAPFIDPASAKLDVISKDATANANYKDLFALYRGLVALQNLATQAQGKNVPPSQLAQIQSTFSRGVSEIHSFLNGQPFKGIELTAAAAQVNATAGAVEQTETDSYTTGQLVSGSKDALLSNLPADQKFTLTATKPNGSQVVVNFDLSTIANQPPSLNDLVNYLNTKLAGASLNTRFSTSQIAATPQTIGQGSSQITLSQGKVGYGLKVVGVSTEQLSFTPDAGAPPAVYVAQAAGASGLNPLTGQTASATQQLLTLNADPANTSATDVLRSKTLASNVAGAVATAAGPDGALYVVSTESGKTADGQALKGATDLVLTKYDSAGQVAFTQALGAAGAATGVTVAVSPDGKSVAVAGAVTGALDATDPAGLASTQTDTVVASFNTANGAEAWTTRAATTGGDKPTAIAFGADGLVYVTGTQASATSELSQTGYLQAFSAKGASLWTTNFGGSGFTTPAAVTVSGSTLYAASNENGHGIVRSYTLNGTSAPTFTAARDLGSLQGGSLAGVGVAGDGSVIVAGTTANPALSVGQINTPSLGGTSAFVAKLSASLAPDGSEALNYFGSGSATSANGLAVSGGEAYITGQIAGAASGGQTTHEGYAAAVNPTTGQVTWSDLLPGAKGQDAPSSIAVAQNGVSVLGALGLPSGAINYTPDTKLVDETALRPGDQFTISTGPGVANKVTIEASDTLTSLAQKINQASGFQTNANVIFANGVNKLQIATRQAGSQVSIEAGPPGANALVALGLSEGVITQNALSTKVVAKTNSVKSSPYALGLPSTLNLSSAANIKTAQTDIAAAIKVVQQAYSDLTTPPKKTAPARSASSAKALAAINSHTANYQNALSRLSALTGLAATSSSPSLATQSSSGVGAALLGG